MAWHLVHDSSLPQQLVEGGHIVVHRSDMKLQQAGSGLSTLGAASHSCPAYAVGSLKARSSPGGKATLLDVVGGRIVWHSYQAEPDSRSALWGAHALCSIAIGHVIRQLCQARCTKCSEHATCKLKVCMLSAGLPKAALHVRPRRPQPDGTSPAGARQSSASQGRKRRACWSRAGCGSSP